MTRMIGHGLIPLCTYPVGADALRAATGPAHRLVLAAVAGSGTQMAGRAAEAAAVRLSAPLVEFPGDHAPRVVTMGGEPAPFAARLREVLAGWARVSVRGRTTSAFTKRISICIPQ